MQAATADHALFTLASFSYVIYVFCLKTLHKYRKTAPFNQSFFKLLFHIGILDLLMMTERQLFYRFPTRGWLGFDSIAMTRPWLFAKIHVILFWYLAKPQVLSTLFLTINRFLAIVFEHNWTTRQMNAFVVSLWLLPLPFNVPLWTQNFYFLNCTGGRLLLLYQDKTFQWYYMSACFVQCAIVLLSSVICYAWIFVYNYRNQLPGQAQNNSHNRNIIFLGLVLTALLLECTCACGVMAYSADPQSWTTVLPWFEVGTELYCYINPYCLLVTSPVFRKHFWATLCCRNVNSVQPLGATAKARIVKQHRVPPEQVERELQHESEVEIK